MDRTNDFSSYDFIPNHFADNILLCGRIQQFMSQEDGAISANSTIVAKTNNGRSRWVSTAPNGEAGKMAEGYERQWRGVKIVRRKERGIVKRKPS